MRESLPNAQPARKALSWRQDPEKVRRDILAIAREEFVDKGLSGARVDEIAARTSTSKRMIYYYFGSKEELYQAVLEEAYGRIRGFEKSLDLATRPPVEAMAALTRFSFDYHAENPDFVRLVMIENIHYARHLKASAKIGAINHPAIEIVSDIYRRGLAEGTFRSGITPLDIHLTITAMSFHNVSNKETVAQVLAHDMSRPDIHRKRCISVVETVLRMVCTTNDTISESTTD
jgi:AcrR family transcriptional regulator